MNPSYPIRGFTLIELMIVIVIVAVLATIAAPNMADFVDKRRASAAGEDIYGIIQMARSEAIKQSTDIRVTVVADGSDAWFVGLSYDAAVNCADDLTCVINIGADPVTKWVDSGANNFPDVSLALVGGTSATQIFIPRGVTAGTTPTRLVVTSARGWQLRVDVNALGRTRICSPNAAKNPGAYRPCT